jgi:uncharacterized membrane protein
MGNCSFRTNKHKIPNQRSVERLGVFNCVFFETGLGLKGVIANEKDDGESAG